MSSSVVISVQKAIDLYLKIEIFFLSISKNYLFLIHFKKFSLLMYLKNELSKLLVAMIEIIDAN